MESELRLLGGMLMCFRRGQAEYQLYIGRKTAGRRRQRDKHRPQEVAARLELHVTSAKMGADPDSGHEYPISHLVYQPYFDPMVYLRTSPLKKSLEMLFERQEFFL